jgi:predicted NBD/HSP70 family sugar kinase
VIGAGLALPGPLQRQTGVVSSTAILPAWVGVGPADEMRRRLELPIIVDNDANVAALAEAAFGAGSHASDLIYLMASSGIGAGMLLSGRLYRGADGLAGELGHVLVDPGGRVCRCGNRGCLETVAGADALAELLRLSHGEGLDGPTIVRMAQEGDLGCRRVIGDAGRAIGRAAATLVNVLNPELLVVGGDLAQAGDLLLDGVRETLALAALLSGYTIDSAGYGLHHVLSQTLARLGGVGHGPSNAVMLPHTLVALDRRGATGAAALVALATDLADRAAASRLRDLGVDEATLDTCADAAAERAELDHTPPRADRDELRALYAAAY